jgi:hypothetical protein
MVILFIIANEAFLLIMTAFRIGGLYTDFNEAAYINSILEKGFEPRLSSEFKFNGTLSIPKHLETENP